MNFKHGWVALIMLTLAIATPATQAAYPEKNIQYIIPFAAGGESDIKARWQQTIFRKKELTGGYLQAAKRMGLLK